MPGRKARRDRYAAQAAAAASQSPFHQPSPPGNLTEEARAPEPAAPDAEGVLRNQARVMAGYGLARKDIAVAMGLAEGELSFRFQTELEQGDASAKVNLGRSGYEMAVGRAATYDAFGRKVREELKPDRSVLIFLLKHRLGFTDMPKQDPFESIDFSRLDRSEMETLVQLLAKAERVATADAPGAANDETALSDGAAGPDAARA